MALLHSCCIPAAAATAPQHIVPPLTAPPLIVVCAADTDAASSSSSFSCPVYPPTARSAAGVALADDPHSARTNCCWGVGRAGGGGGGRSSRPASAGVTLNGPSPRDSLDAIAGLLPPSCSDTWRRHTLRWLCATTALRYNRVCFWRKRHCLLCCTGRMSWVPSAPHTSSLGRPMSHRSREAQWIVSLLRNWQALMLQRMVEFYLIRLIYYLASLFQ
jgi:hypothetical protein